MKLGRLAPLLLILLLPAAATSAGLLSDTALVRVTTHPSRDTEPSVSPDGRWVAFASQRSGNWDIWVKHVRGGIPYRITSNPAIDRQPRWTHDGHGILFVSTRDDPAGDVYRVEVKRKGSIAWPAGPPRRLTPRFCLDTEPDPHPKGKRVVFISDRSGQPSVWLLWLGNLHTRLLAAGPAQNPRWSPDGRWLAWIGAGANGPALILAPYDTKRDTLAGPPDTLALPAARAVRAFDFDPAQRFLACLLVDNVNESPVHTRLYLIPLPDTVSLRGRSGPSPLDSLPTRPYALTFEPRPTARLAWRHGYRLMFEKAGDIFGIGAVGRVPVSSTAEAQLAWAEEHVPAPTHLSQVRRPVPSRSNLWRRIEALTRVLDFFPHRPEAVVRALYRRACTWWLLSRTGAARSDADSLLRLAPDPAPIRFAAKLLLADLNSVRPGQSILYPSQILPTADTLAYARLASNPSAPPRIRHFAALRLAQIHSQRRDTSAAERIVRDLLMRLPDEDPLLPAVLWLQLQLSRSHRRTPATFAPLLEHVQPDEPLAELVAGKILEDRLPPRSGLVDTLKCLVQVSDSLALDSPKAAQMLRYLAGHLALERGRHAEAEELLRPIQNAVPNLRPYVLVDLACALHALGEFQSAAALLDTVRSQRVRQSAEARRELVAVLLDWAKTLAAEGQFARALPLLRKARTLAPESPAVHRELIGISAKLGLLDQTVTHYRQAHLLDPQNATLQYAYGLALSYLATREAEKTGDLSRIDEKTLTASTTVLQEALRKDYTLVPAYLALAFNYAQTEAFRRIPSKSGGRLLRRVFRFATAPFRAVYEFVTGTSGKPALGFYERAIQLLRIALQINDETKDPGLEADILLSLANYTYALGPYSYPEALDLYRRRQKLGIPFLSEPQEAEVFFRMGKCALATGEVDSAVTYFRRAWKAYARAGSGERAFVAAGLYAFSLIQADRNQSAAAVLRELLRSRGRTAPPRVRERLHRNLALAYLGAGQVDSCLAHVWEAQDLLLSGQVPDVKRSPVRITVEILGWGIPVPFLDLRRFGLEKLGATRDLTNAEEMALLEQIASDALLRCGRLSQALRHLHRKAKVLRKAGSEEALGRTLHRLGQIYLQASIWNEASDAFHESWRIALANHDFDGVFANLDALLRAVLYAGNAPCSDSTREALRSRFQEMLGQTSRALQKTKPTPRYWRLALDLLRATVSLGPTKPPLLSDSTRIDSLVDAPLREIGRYHTVLSLVDSVSADTSLMGFSLFQSALKNLASAALELGDLETAYAAWNRLRHLGFRDNEPGVVAQALIQMAATVRLMPIELRRKLQIPWTPAQLAASGKELLVAACLQKPPALPEHRQLLRTAYRILLDPVESDSVATASLIDQYARDLLTLLLSPWHPANDSLRLFWGQIHSSLIAAHARRSGVAEHLGLTFPARPSEPPPLVGRSSKVRPRSIRLWNALLHPEAGFDQPDSLREILRSLLFSSDGSARALGPEEGRKITQTDKQSADSSAAQLHANAIVPLFSALTAPGEKVRSLKFRTVAELLSTFLHEPESLPEVGRCSGCGSVPELEWLLDYLRSL